MSDVSSAQLVLHRKQPQQVSLHLSIYKPNVVIACKVNDASIAKGARSITYNTVSAGSYTKVASGMPMWVGSTPGGKDLGKVRVKSATSTVFTVAENSDIRWANGVYLTVYDLIDIVPIFPRIISNPSNEEDTIWYKDYDIEYTNQNSILGTYICMGPHRAATLDDSGQALIYYSATGTQNVNGDPVSYRWEFPGASGVTGSTALTPGYITYTSPGHYAAKLTVSGSGGSIDYSYRYVSIHDRASVAQDWQISNLPGSRNSAGFATTIKINKPYDYDIYDGAIVVIYSDEWYGNTQTKLGGNAENNNGIYFVGYILQDTIRWNWEKSSVEFQVASITEMMRLVNGFAISLENSANPTKWYEIKGNNLRKAVYHFLRWHSTVMLTTDVQFLATDYNVQYFDTNRESLFDAVNGVLKSALMGELTSDRQGKLWIETSMEATPSAKTAYPPKFTLAKDDWVSEPNIQEVPYNQLSYIELGGVVFDPLAVAPDNSIALLSAAPGATPSTHGKVEAPTGLALSSQTQLNQLSGDVFAFRNARKPTIDVPMRGSWKNLDIAPLESILVNIAPTDTSRNISVSGTYYIDSVDGAYNSENQTLMTSVILREITEGVPGDTLIIPVTPPTDGYTVPPFTFPTFPPIEIPTIYIEPPVEIWSSPGILALFTVGTDPRLWFTSEFDSATPKWYAATTPFDWPLADLAAVTRFDMSRWGRAYLAVAQEIFQQDVGGSGRTSLRSVADFTTDMGAATFTVQALGIHPTDDKSVAVWTSMNSSVAPYSVVGYVSDPSTGLLSYKYKRTTERSRFSGMASFYIDKWYKGGRDPEIGGENLYRYSEDLVTRENSLSIESYPGGTVFHAHALNADYIYARTYVITSLGTVKTALPYQAHVGNQCIACDPTGQYVMMASGATIGTLKKSTDFGVSFADVTLPHAFSATTCRIINLGNANEWVVVYNQTVSASLNILYTNDFGVNWVSKAGNLLDYVTPTNGVMAVKFA